MLLFALLLALPGIASSIPENIHDAACVADGSLHLLQTRAPERRHALKRVRDQKCVDVHIPVHSYRAAGALSLSGMCLVMAACYGLATPAAKQAAQETADPTAAAAVAAAWQPEQPPLVLQRTGSRPVRILCLDGLRTVAVVCVIVYHVNVHARESSLGMYKWGKDLDFWPFRKGVWCMQFLMVLSGFSMSYSQGSEPCGLAWGRYQLAKRIAQFAPAYYVVFWWNFMIAHAKSPGSSLSFPAWPIASVFLEAIFAWNTCGHVDHYLNAYAAMGPGWFASDMLILSALFPLLSRLVPRGGRSAAAALVIVTFLRSVPTVFQAQLHTPTESNSVIDWYIFPVPRIPEFFAGMLTARIYHCLPRNIVEHRAWGWVFDASLVLTFILGSAAPLGADSWGDGPRPPAALKDMLPHDEGLWGDGYTTGPSCLVVLAACCAAQSGKDGRPVSGLLGSLLALWPLTVLSVYGTGAFLLQDLVFKSEMSAVATSPRELAVMTVLLSFALAVPILHLQIWATQLVNLRFKGLEGKSP